MIALQTASVQQPRGAGGLSIFAVFALAVCTLSLWLALPFLARQLEKLLGAVPPEQDPPTAVAYQEIWKNRRDAELDEE